MSSKADRTERATAKRRLEAREKGQIPRSREVASAVTFICLFVAVAAWGGYFLSEFESLFHFFWRNFLTQEINARMAHQLILSSAWGVIKLAGPLVGLTLVAALGSVLAQGGLVLTAEPLKFSADKINPQKNIQKVFSKRGLVELAKSVVLVAIVSYLAFSVLRDYSSTFQTMVAMDVRSIVSVWGAILFKICTRVAIFLGLIAAADYAFQRYRHEEDLKMTKQQIKDEFKDTEGQPMVKSRIRRLQREMASKRMMSAVQDADVVVTNPTHFAVALKYDMESMSAPRVVAKGQGFIAQKIKSLAEEHKVPKVENVALAQALYKAVDIGGEVPAELYKAVAQILAYVYKLKEESYH